MFSPISRAWRAPLTALCLLAASPAVLAQVSCIPVFPNASDNVTITYDATQGNGALLGVSPVWGHFGVITSASQGPSDWKHVATQWGVNNAAAQMSSAGPNRWSKTFNINTFFNIQPGETVLKLAFVFRDGSGNTVGRAADGSDIFYDVYPENGPLQTAILAPTSALFLASPGQNIPVTAAASTPASLRLYDNGAQVAAANNAELLQHNLSAAAPGVHLVTFVATTANASDTSRFTYIVPGNTTTQDPPAGTEWGIRYLSDTRARLALYAPGKQVVHLIGDFNQWQPTDAHQMKRSADGSLWWAELDNLPPGQPVRFQYLVDGSLRIADPLSTLVLDPWNDAFIPPFTYPNLPPYPAGKTNGAASVLQTAQPPFPWQASGYQRPKKTDLVVYELLLRDFVARHDYPTLLDTLDYLEKLGITAIELMPVNEFDGNISWGYNPAYHKALDKYYGTAEDLKTLVDECHKRGMAVILDVVFNQATGASPLARLYWDTANNRPAADNPWLNPQPTHDFNVFNDFNHESAATKTYVKNCLKHWIEEFRVDGFRFDLSKGFTQKNTVGNIAAWNAYDASRVAILRDYADFIWSIDPTNYVILEHFADNSEEKALADYGMMLWGNMWGAYKDIALGYTTAPDLSGVSHTARGWAQPHLIGYMESHDEDRLAYECKTYGNAVPAHNIRTLPVIAQRLAMLENLLFTVPGPKMLWQFGELAYDFPINLCENGSVNPDCRTAPKPIRWDYLQDPYRKNLYNVTAALLHLRKNLDVFESGSAVLNLGSGQVRSIFLSSPSVNAAVFANVGITPTTVTSPAFQHGGLWHEYYTGEALDVSLTTSLTLKPGEYRLYLDQYVPLPNGVSILPTKEPEGSVAYFGAQPNPFGAELALQVVLASPAELWLTIADLSGRSLEERALGQMAEGEHLLSLSTGDWAAGIYFAILRDTEGRTTAQKIVKR